MKAILGLVAQRLALGAYTLLVVSFVIFSAVELLPGDLATERLGQAANPETVAAFRARYGLEGPFLARYADWLSGAVRGDFGLSLASQRPIADLVGPRAGNTFFLAAYAAAIAVPTAILLGLLAALWRESAFDKIASSATLAAISFPEYFVAYILILVFSVSLSWFPLLASVDASTPFLERLHALFLPALTLTLIVVAHMMRMTRAAIVNLLASPYVEMAHLKGM